MRKETKNYHHGDLPRALLDAVVELVAERGSAAEVTLRQVARRAAVSHNAPYRHFADKGAILAAVATEGFADLAHVLRSARVGVADDEERFIRTGIAYLRFTQERPGHTAVMFGPEIRKSRTRELQQAANESFQLVKALAVDAGIADLLETRRLGAVAWSFLHGLAVLTANNQVPPSVQATPDALATLGLRQLFHAFRAAAGAATTTAAPRASSLRPQKRTSTPATPRRTRVRPLRTC
jgi:AcrR family transcriptional regulator